jgi:drug/metabolite transporter (DMT)-like permease
MNRPRTYWLDRKENVTKVYWAVWVLCGLLLLIDPLIHKHEEFEFAEWFGFFGFFGFVACVGLVLTAKALRRILKRPEDYYER